MDSLFTYEVYKDIISRVDKIEKNKKPLWGKMNPSQMLAHCQQLLKIALGKTTEIKEPFFKKLLLSFYKHKLFDDSEWKKNLPTTDQFRVEDERDFKKEKEGLTKLISEFHKKKGQATWPKHPVFGKFNEEQWGKMQFKHLNHHLKQFGV